MTEDTATEAEGKGTVELSGAMQIEEAAGVGDRRARKAGVRSAHAVRRERRGQAHVPDECTICLRAARRLRAGSGPEAAVGVPGQAQVEKHGSCEVEQRLNAALLKQTRETKA